MFAEGVISKRGNWLFAVGALGFLLSTAPPTHADWDGPILSAIEGGEEFWLAIDAYIYGYPLVTMEMTRRVITNVAAPEGTHAPMGQLIRLRQYPNASFKDVTAQCPNFFLGHTSSERHDEDCGNERKSERALQ